MDQNDLPAGDSTRTSADAAGDTFGNTGSNLGSAGYGVGASPGNPASNTGSTTSDASIGSPVQGGFSDRVREFAGSAQDTLADVSSSVREQADDVKGQIAQKVEAGMDRLKQVDFDSVKQGLERQVREHPGRTLLMAVGIGYLMGRAIRK